MPSASQVREEVETQLTAMRAGAAEFYGENELRERLTVALGEGRPLRVKLGMDPSSPDLHLGHAVVLQKLRCFQDLGHTPIFLVGDFTARIGDPSGKKKTRPALSAEQVRENAATYVAQVGLLLDVERAEVRFNSEWMDSMSTSDFVRLCSQQTVARLVERDDFARRLVAGSPIAVHELLYPFVQAYDSVALAADVELGGTDQTFNLLMAREVQRAYGQPPQAVITHPLLVGIDGVEKMSKSLGNAIGLAAPADEMFGLTMRISDALMIEYRQLLLDLPVGDDGVGAGAPPAAESGPGDPMAAKLALARALVVRFHGGEAADRALAHFERVVRKKEVPAEVPEVAVEVGPAGERGLLEALVEVGLARSNSEVRRLVLQRAVSLDGSPVEDPGVKLGPGSYLVRMGKRRFVQLRVG